MKLVSLASLCGTFKNTVNPQNQIEKEFIHYSIPAFNNGLPVREYGKDIKSNKIVVDKPCILFSRLNPRIRRVWDLSNLVNKNNSIASTEFVPFVIKNNQKLHNRYLYWFLHTERFLTFARAGVQAATKSRERVNKKSLFSVKIPLPPLEEQKRIAKILDVADGIIQKRKQAIALTEELLKSTFLDMFGDPVLNPKGWEVVKFKNIFKNIKYGTGSPPIFEDKGIPFIRATNIKKGTVLANDLKFISESEARKIEKCKLKIGNILIVRSGVNSGDSALITEEYKDSYAGYDIIIDIDPFLSIFYNYLINSDSEKQIIKPLTKRSGQPHLNANQIKNLRFIFPSQEEIKKFNNFFEETTKLKQKHAETLKESENLFNALLQKAFKGEL